MPADDSAPAQAEKHAGGRPSKYDPAFCDVVQSALAEGYSLDACAGLIPCARSTIYEWIDAHPEFSDAVKVGQSQSALWWERELRTIAQKGGGPGRATAVIFGLKNRAPDSWREKTEHEHTGAMGVTYVVPTGAAPAMTEEDYES